MRQPLLALLGSSSLWARNQANENCTAFPFLLQLFEAHSCSLQLQIESIIVLTWVIRPLINISINAYWGGELS